MIGMTSREMAVGGFRDYAGFEPAARGRWRARRGDAWRARGTHHRRSVKVFYSHSMVAGGLLVMSRTTRLTSGTSLVTRVEIRARTSAGSRAQSAVLASSLGTGRSTSRWP